MSAGDVDDASTCVTCGAKVPALAFLTGEQRASVLAMIEGGNSIQAIRELRRLGVRDLAQANAWVFHRGQAVPHPAPTAPCPYCGMALRTPQAQQCRHCGRDWHEVHHRG